MLAKCRSLASAVAFRVTAYIGRLPYRQVVATLREFLPVSEPLNHGTVRNRALRAGRRLDDVESVLDWFHISMRVRYLDRLSGARVQSLRQRRQRNAHWSPG